MSDIKYAVIGAGITGTATAYKIKEMLGEEAFVIEKNKSINGENQTAKNSCVVHAGIYYNKKKQPLKAELCVKGNEMLYDFCKDNGVFVNNTGKLVVATNKLEEDYVRDVYETAKNNGVPGVEIISGEKARELEPNVDCISALYVPSSGIVDPTELVTKLYQLGPDENFVFGSEVKDIKQTENGLELLIRDSDGDTSTITADYVINAGGLFADEIAKKANPESKLTIDPTRGEAAKYNTHSGIIENGKIRQELKQNLSAKMNIYPSPFGYWIKDRTKAEIPLNEFKELFEKGEVGKTVGVHLTPVKDGSIVTLGPLYAKNSGKEDYSHSHDTKAFFEKVKDFFPNLKPEDLELHQTGIQAIVKGNPDFHIQKDEKIPNLINAVLPSPGLTACLAVGEYIVNNFLREENAKRS